MRTTSGSFELAMAMLAFTYHFQVGDRLGLLVRALEPLGHLIKPFDKEVIDRSTRSLPSSGINVSLEQPFKEVLGIGS